ncbi:hypothetical protein AB0C27_21885 [Nonomuraea sp. NPDC048882]|uniref:hypothetical protein n=1 Tax=unclassified Nonomuraea TaxID=2593643 RepID=UPI0033DE97FD
MKAAVERGAWVASVSALAVGALTVTLLGTTPAQAFTAESGAATAAPCRKVASANGDTVRLWYCNGTGGTRRGYHAQAKLGNGANVSLRDSRGQNVVNPKVAAAGVLPRWYNTPTTLWSGPFKACSGYRGSTGTCTRLAR